MKLTLILGILFSFSAFAKSPSLFVKEGRQFIDVEQLIADDEDVQANYGYENFCYKGDSNAVIQKIKKWNRMGVFFSGDGGGFDLKKVTLIRGIVTYDISLTFEDEVVPGEFRTVNVKPCSVK